MLNEKDIHLSDIVEVITINYGEYHELATKYIGLQHWIKEQEKLQNDNPN